MARPTKFNTERGRALIRSVAAGGGRREAARAAGVGLRTLAEWIARGRAGEHPFDGWVKVFEQAERIAWERAWAARCAREEARAKERYQRFKAAREQWWRDQLGEVEFWRRRVAWLSDRNKTHSLGAAVRQFREAMNRG